MEKQVIDQFHHGLNKVTQAAKKDPNHADSAINCLFSSRNALQKRGGSLKLNSSAYNSGAEIKSIYDWDRHGGDLMHKYLFNSGTSLYEFDLNSGVAGVIKSGLATAPVGEFQYARAGQTLYLGNGFNQLKYYSVAEITTGGDTVIAVDAANERLGQSFLQAHLNNRDIASISLPLVRVGTITGGINMTVEIRPDSGANVPHASTVTATSQTIGASLFSTNWSWVSFTFSSLVTLTANTTYWIVLRSSSALGGSEGTIGWAIDGTGITAGGFATYSPSSWSADVNKDGLYAVFVSPDNWGIVAPTTIPTLGLTAATSGKQVITGQDTDRELNGDSVGNLAMSFTPDTGANIGSVELYLKKIDSALAGNISVRIETDLAGTPSGTLVGEASANVTATGVGTGYAFITFTFTNSVALNGAETYWIVLQGDTTYDAAYLTGVDTIVWGTDADDSAAFTGDFAMRDADRVANGGFATDTLWTKGDPSWTISSSAAHKTAGVSSGLSQNNSAIATVSYEVKFTISNRTAGSIAAVLGGTSGTFRSTNATHTETIVAGSGADPRLVLLADSSFAGDIDSVSVKQISAWGPTTATAADEKALFKVNNVSKWTLGGRSYRISFKNSITGHISNPSTATPFSGNTLADVVTLSSFPTTTDPQVDKMIIWATTDGGGIYWFLAEVAATTTSYSDDTSDEELNYTREAPFDNAPPPAGFLIERVKSQILMAGVGSDPHRVFYSGSAGQVLEGVAEESFPPLNYQSVPSGSERIYAISQLDNIPWIFTPDQIFGIYGETAESFRLGPTRGGEQVGSRSRRGTVSTELGIFFISNDRKVYLLQSANHLPQLISEIIEDALEGTATIGTTLNVVGIEKARIEYINFGDMHWIVLAIATAGAAVNDNIYVYDLDLHAAHPGFGWSGPWTLAGTQPFQCLEMLTDSVGTKFIYAGDNAGFIRKLNTGTQDDGANITATYESAWMDFSHPDLVKDALTLELILPASQTKPAISVSLDTENNYEALTFIADNEMERGASKHRHTAYINKHFTRMKIKGVFAAEAATGEIWQIIVYWEPLFDKGGAIYSS